jgi:hypothetical protein
MQHHNAQASASFCTWKEEDSPMTCFTSNSKYWKSGAPEAPGVVEGSTEEATGVGAGSTTVVVSTGAPQPQGGAVMGNNMVGLDGVDGVASNVFAKEAICNVDVQPTERKDLCCESYCCFVCGAGGHSWFFKIPDCLGMGSNCTTLLGSEACTCKFLQKPTFCEVLCYYSLLDMSTCCSNKGENDDTCCSLETCASQCTWCCIIQTACKVEHALMRTCIKSWCWVFFNDCRCACPPNSFAPLQCTLCGFGYRMYENGGCGCRVRANTQEDQAPAAAGGTTTVVVVNQGS